MTVFSPNKTSAKLLVDYASERWGGGDATPESHRRYLMIYDLYIKARSYSIINKVTFWFAIGAGIMVLLWPSLAIVTKDFGFEKEFLKSAIVQTTITGLALLTFAVYSHYKKRQMFVENLMRTVVYSDEDVGDLLERVVGEIARIDSGFGFSKAIRKDGDRDAER